MVREGAVRFMKERGYERLTLDEVAALAKQSRATLYRAIDRGDLPVIKIGSSLRISRDAAQKYLDGLQKST